MRIPGHSLSLTRTHSHTHKHSPTYTHSHTQVKDVVCREFALLHEECYLTCGGKQLLDHMTLYDYNICHQHTITASLRLLGGSKRSRDDILEDSSDDPDDMVLQGECGDSDRLILTRELMRELGIKPGAGGMVVDESEIVDEGVLEDAASAIRANAKKTQKRIAKLEKKMKKLKERLRPAELHTELRPGDTGTPNGTGLRSRCMQSCCCRLHTHTHTHTHSHTYSHIWLFFSNSATSALRARRQCRPATVLVLAMAMVMVSKRIDFLTHAISARVWGRRRRGGSDAATSTTQRGATAAAAV
jgi:hypothetical protein